MQPEDVLVQGTLSPRGARTRPARPSGYDRPGVGCIQA
ncbi:hypothetical protein AZ78_0758 [Lysobacter capsici AZ78]|uniref:Uncharacterized protein n=1 Tax=Lysobacter capsici AZ78 TaxID=1444315 RepID=A0A108U623_9GAMM|nr:hypothetical protein AZ78_0758 [Lysobacter capsici AZ78]